MMTLNDQDARALTHLARRIRQDTYGANQWDEPGVFAVVSELVGQNLALSIERVCRHAADPTAKTPGAIRRPFLPDAPTPTSERPRNVAPVGSRCTVCDAPTPVECTPDHEFTRPIAQDPDLHGRVATVKGHLEPMRDRPEPAHRVRGRS